MTDTAPFEDLKLGQCQLRASLWPQSRLWPLEVGGMVSPSVAQSHPWSQHRDQGRP